MFFFKKKGGFILIKYSKWLCTCSIVSGEGHLCVSRDVFSRERFAHAHIQSQEAGAEAVLWLTDQGDVHQVILRKTIKFIHSVYEHWHNMTKLMCDIHAWWRWPQMIDRDKTPGRYTFEDLLFDIILQLWNGSLCMMLSKFDQS